METDDRFQRGAIARQFEHHRSAEAEPDRRQPPGIDLGQRGERTSLNERSIREVPLQGDERAATKRK